jgi:hypothetical protein
MSKILWDGELIAPVIETALNQFNDGVAPAIIVQDAINGYLSRLEAVREKSRSFNRVKGDELKAAHADAQEYRIRSQAFFDVIRMMHHEAATGLRHVDDETPF